MFDRMFQHVGKNGAAVPIAAMDDAHLLNMIALVAGKMETARAALGVGETAMLSDFDRAVYGVKAASTEDVAEMVREGMRILAPYVLEAVVRRLDVSADVQAAIGRSARLGGVPALVDREFNLP